MKKLMMTLMALVMVISFSHTRPVKASVLGVSGAGSLAMAGFYGAFGLGIAAHFDLIKNDQNQVRRAFNFLWKATAVMIVLDAQNGQAPVFQEVKPGHFGISKAEAESFNSELDKVNAIVVEVTDSLAVMQNPELEAATKLWNAHKDSLSPLTLSAMTKLSHQ